MAAVSLREDSRQFERRLIRQHFRLHFDGDWWGTVIGCLFAICHVLQVRCQDIPDEWEYRSGNMTTPERVDPEQSLCFELFHNQELFYFGNVLVRLMDKLRRQGRSY